MGCRAVADTIRALAAAGADVDAPLRRRRRTAETPLHWAASADDVPALDALLDAGADIDATGGVIGARHAAQRRDRVRPVARRASGSSSAARGRRGSTPPRSALLDRLDDVPADELDPALWGACPRRPARRGGARCSSAGPIPPGSGWDELTPLGAAQRSGATDVVALLSARRS